MRHRVQRSRLNRQNSHRKATVNSLVRNLVIRNRIQTTLPKARVASRLANRLMTLGKRGDISAQRLAFETLQSRELVYRLLHTLAPLFKSRQGGYTRIVKLVPRRGDAAPMALLEWVEFPLEEVKTPQVFLKKEQPTEEKIEKKAEKEKRPFLKALRRFFRQPATSQ